MADEFVWKLEDTADFVAGRMLAAMRRYRKQLLPPFTAALMEFAQVHEYSWHTPGHTGGTAFLKSPVGRKFHALLGFTGHYDSNTQLSHIMPTLTGEHGGRYAGLGVRDLADQMFDCVKESQKLECLARTFSQLPHAAMTPAQAYRRLVHGEVETVPLENAANRIMATGVVPYPPGIPTLMPGENVGPDDCPILAYLRALQEWDRRFPGFAHDIHGVECQQGTYYLTCLT